LSPAYDQLPAAILLDSLVQSFLFGLVLGQAVKYWRDFGDNPWRKKGYVIVIVLLSMQTFLQNLKVWRVAIQHQEWV
ncbi:hypothetical protein C8J56DRAFT_984840, partial [Mycena floridula]